MPDVLEESVRELFEPVNCCLQTVTGERAPIQGNGQLKHVISKQCKPMVNYVLLFFIAAMTILVCVQIKIIIILVLLLHV